MNKKYKSRYGANSDITAAQYLVEFIMERIAKKEKTTLPFKFWNIPKWNKIFRMQIKYANELLDDYTESEIFAALKTKKGERIYSLGAKKTMITPLVEETKKKRKENLDIAQKVSSQEVPQWEENWLDDEEDEEELRKTIGKKETNLWSQLG